MAFLHAPSTGGNMVFPLVGPASLSRVTCLPRLRVEPCDLIREHCYIGFWIPLQSLPSFDNHVLRSSSFVRLIGRFQTT